METPGTPANTAHPHTQTGTKAGPRPLTKAPRRIRVQVVQQRQGCSTVGAGAQGAVGDDQPFERSEGARAVDGGLHDVGDGETADRRQPCRVDETAMTGDGRVPLRAGMAALTDLDMVRLVPERQTPDHRRRLVAEPMGRLQLVVDGDDPGDRSPTWRRAEGGGRVGAASDALPSARPDPCRDHRVVVVVREVDGGQLRRGQRARRSRSHGHLVRVMAPRRPSRRTSVHGESRAGGAGCGPLARRSRCR